MSGFFENLLQGAAGTFFGGDYLRDYTHASKTFRPNSYQNAPKFKYLFHTYFEINPEAYGENVNTGSNYGLLVKTVKLPSFQFEVAVLNQYNRKRLVQSKIKYDPIDITFHDDHGTAPNTPNSGGTIRSLWKAYYNYYYADGTVPQVVLPGTPGTPPRQLTSGAYPLSTDATYNDRNQYKPSITGNDNWGLTGESANPSGSKIPFFKQITIFGLSQHNWTAYTLINPIITRFSHDTYSYAEGTGVMEHQMSIDYETVVYNDGGLSGKAPGNIVTGFGDDANYDRTPSPIMRPGANRNILGQGGLKDAAGGIINNLTPDPVTGKVNLLGAIQTAGTAYNTFKNVNLGSLAKTEITSGIINAVGQTPNRNLNVSTPIFGSTPQTNGTAGAPPSNAQANPQQVGTPRYAGTSNSGVTNATPNGR